MSKAVSRVMSWMIIYLDISLPICSSNLPESWRATICFLLGLASSGVYTDPRCYHRSGSLLHYHFILTSKLAVLFLLHFPGSHLHRPLAGTLPYEARTFLTCVLSAIAAAIICSTHKLTKNSIFKPFFATFYIRVLYIEKYI